MNAEQTRLQTPADWRKWGPYLSDRQWGTVREDYSPDGDAWNYLTHDQARSRAFRWGEDGIGGLADDQCLLCFAPAFWNRRDPILKERLFGLTNGEGNHGEDVKELYFFLENTPSHSFERMLYKYPQAEFPYKKLLAENARRTRLEPEFEILDSGVFAENRYFDCQIEYAKASPDDILIKITVSNRGPEAAPLVVLPTVWFRNRWAVGKMTAADAQIRWAENDALELNHAQLGSHFFYAQNPTDWLFCQNENNNRRLFDAPNSTRFSKDGFHDFFTKNDEKAVFSLKTGHAWPSEPLTKATPVFEKTLVAGETWTIRARLSAAPNSKPFADFEPIFSRRQAECADFYADLKVEKEARQAFAGLLWSKQFYGYDVSHWLAGDASQPPPPASRRTGRNADWPHFVSKTILSMPDAWEYPWFAAWDLAFHCVAFAKIDPDFAKNQLLTLVSEAFLHPSGQIPAYEWNFSDVNPPVQAWATWRVFEICGSRDLDFLEKMYAPLVKNFNWWISRKDSDGNDIFGGGFLGLDNIGLFNRSEALPNGERLEQADATAWVAMFSLNLMRIALELALKNPKNRTTRTREAAYFFEKFLEIAHALTIIGQDNRDLWDEADEFYYDALRQPDGSSVALPLRSIVGLVPLFAVEVLEDEKLTQLPDFQRLVTEILLKKPEFAALISRWHEPQGDRRLLSLLRGHRTKALLRRMLDEAEFWSPFGVRALSKIYENEPFRASILGENAEIKYLPAESDSAMFGGNSNWRGPVWMPVNFLLVEALRCFHDYYSTDFQVECPTGSGQFLSLGAVAELLAARLKLLFLADSEGRRPVHRGFDLYQNDPFFNDLVLFFEYFHGDTGRGVGASHQTGWTALAAIL